MNRRIVVTGLGLVCPIGNTVEQSWANAVAGKSGISLIDVFDTTDFSVKIGGTIKDFDVTEYLSAKEARRMDPFIHFGLAASIQAMKDSGLEVTDENARRIGAAIGSGIGGLPGIEKGYQSYLDGGARKVSPFFVPSNIINMVAGNLSIMYGLKGPNYAMVTACSTGAHCIGNASRMIERGDVDVMVAGSQKGLMTPPGMGFVYFNDKAAAARGG